MLVKIQIISEDRESFNHENLPTLSCFLSHSADILNFDNRAEMNSHDNAIRLIDSETGELLIGEMRPTDLEKRVDVHGRLFLKGYSYSFTPGYVDFFKAQYIHDAYSNVHILDASFWVDIDNLDELQSNLGNL